MKTSKFVQLLQAKIEEANQNIIEIKQFHLVNERTFGYHAFYYDEEQVEVALNKLKQWQQVLQDILKTYYESENHENYIRFNDTINHVKEGFDYKTELPKEYKKGITVLIGIIETIELLNDMDAQLQDAQTSQRPRKIFISHSKLDVDFVKELIRLLRLMGFEKDEIFCSSVPGYWIEEGKDFLEEIKTHFVNYNLYVIFIHSPRFYESHIALNEMGAAWALQSSHSSFLTTDMEFGMMDGVVSRAEIAVKVNSDDARGRMTSWMDRILKWFGKSTIDMNIWEAERDDFLNRVQSIAYANKSQPESITLSEEDESLLRDWVNSNHSKLRQAWDEGDCVLFVLGSGDGSYVTNGRELAKWQGFFERLLSLGLIAQTGYTDKGKHPEYQLTERAYGYFDNNK